MPNVEKKSAFARKSMASPLSSIWVNGALRLALTASPTEPAIEICASAVSMASAMVESAGPAPSGSPSWLAKPSVTVPSMAPPAWLLMMLPSSGVLGSHTPEMNS